MTSPMRPDLTERVVLRRRLSSRTQALLQRLLCCRVGKRRVFHYFSWDKQLAWHPDGHSVWQYRVTLRFREVAREWPNDLIYPQPGLVDTLRFFWFLLTSERVKPCQSAKNTSC